MCGRSPGGPRGCDRERQQVLERAGGARLTGAGAAGLRGPLDPGPDPDHVLGPAAPAAGMDPLLVDREAGALHPALELPVRRTRPDAQDAARPERPPGALQPPIVVEPVV